MKSGIAHVQEAKLKAEELRSEIHIHDYLYYVKNHSLFLDLIILFETIGVVLTAKGAQ